VSFDDEQLILVDSENSVLGYESKANAHAGKGLLHRAFSIFLFSDTGRVLLQRRSSAKPLWPLYWSNSCCSHPRRGESDLEAAHRRLREELAVQSKLKLLYRFQYHAEFAGAGSERELCSVYAGRVDAESAIEVNLAEIADWRWVACEEVDRMVSQEADRLTPWFRLEWTRLRREFQDELAALSLNRQALGECASG
jgi:isopentenyl-diphosphate delta-isomerase